MTTDRSIVNLLIAQSAENAWGAGLAQSLSPWPVDLHWSCTDAEALDLAASGGMHAAVVDDGLPGAGGLDLLRRFHRLKLRLPCLLVCDRLDQRLLRDALELNVFSVVVQAHAETDVLTPWVLKLVRRVQGPQRPAAGGMN